MNAVAAGATFAVETHGLCMDYGNGEALHELELRVPTGSVFALLGASGAGKTTTLKLLLNLVAPSRGGSRILGRASSALCPEVLARVGYVSENQVLPARLTVEQFFDYLRPLYPRWDPAAERELRTRLALPARRRLGALSHGMRMKMALACALPFHPELLVLDEPLSGLDALARDEIIDGLRTRPPGTTVLLSSHELDEVERFATHVAFLHEGRLLFQGSMSELHEFARPLMGAGSSPALRAIFIAVVRARRAA